MTDERLAERLRRNAAGVASLVVTGVWMGALFTDQGWWLAALIVGYAAVVPLVAVLFGDDADREKWLGDWGHDDEETDDETADEPAEETPLERLRRRYAEGELTDEQFERKLERLLETETLEDAAERRARRERIREEG
jgi:uncharacterized membrane protein